MTWKHAISSQCMAPGPQDVAFYNSLPFNTPRRRVAKFSGGSANNLNPTISFTCSGSEERFLSPRGELYLMSDSEGKLSSQKRKKKNTKNK